MLQKSRHTCPKTGIIYSPRPGRERLWKKILGNLREQQADFDYIRSENSADAERIAAMMTANGYETIIVAGGDAALNYALNGIMKTTAPQGGHPVLGVIPAGYGNDFAKYWGFAPDDCKQAIHHILHRHKRKIDVGRCTVTADGTIYTEYFLNCINIGVAASIMGIKRATHNFFGLRTLSYLTSTLLLLFKRMSYHVTFTTGGERFSYRMMTLCIGSGNGYGMTPSAVPYNGLLDISLITAPPTTQILQGIYLLLTGRFLGHKGIRVWRTPEVHFSDIGGAPVSLDGHSSYNKVHKIDTLHADVMKEEIEFLII